MEYRKLPHGGDNERFSVLGLGMGGIHQAPEAEIEEVVRTALDSGVNFFDMCAGAMCVYAPVGRAIAGRRERVFLQMHFGAVYNEKGEYAWSRDPERILATFRRELDALGTDYTDMGFLHCVDQRQDYDELTASGVPDAVRELKKSGIVRHIGFSSHSPETANAILDTGLADMMMFSLNPAYDFERGDEYGLGTASERQRLLRRCAAEGIGVSVMKPFHAGRLLDAKTSPFRTALTKNQCIQYALDRPGVLTVVPGVRGMDDLRELLTFPAASPEERDYSALGGFTADTVRGTCVYCNHCQPCPAGIDVGLANRYYDLAQAGDPLAAGHYRKLSVKASACRRCGHCDSRCPFGVRQSGRMAEIAACFGE